MALGKRTSTTCASGSSFSLPPSAATTTLIVWLFAELAEPRLLDPVALLERRDLAP